MAGDVTGRIDPEQIARIYESLAEPLRRFLKSLLADEALAEDVVQTAFAKLVEQGANVQPGALRAWLFQVAYREAMLVKRRGRTHAHAARQWAESQSTVSEADVAAALVSAETLEQVRGALTKLSPAQQQVLRMRVYENKAFAEIAKELRLPLGTVLSRMHAALQRLRIELQKLRGKGIRE